MSDDQPDQPGESARPDQPGPSRQTDVYMLGLADITPDVPVSYEALRDAALDALDEEAYNYVAGSAGAERTPEHNRRAFEDYRIRPRMLRDVERRDRSVDLFGTTYDNPLLLAPIGVLSIIHDDAELGVARAARSTDVPMILSSAASTSMEDVADELDGHPGWFQLYWSSDREIATSFVDRAEDAGYEALVVTVDTPLLAWRERDVQDAYLPFLEGEGVANYFTDPAFQDRLDHPIEENELAAIKEFVDVFGNPGLTFDDLDWLCDYTDLPVVVKGILHPQDAEAAVDAGAAGVVVSNHGGRQVDNAIAALDALPDVVEGGGDRATVLVDSGIRRGSDVLVALALGADAVLLGRPYVYGLALDGEDGVEAVTANLLADFDLTMGLTGCASIDEIDRDILVDVD